MALSVSLQLRCVTAIMYAATIAVDLDMPAILQLKGNIHILDHTQWLSGRGFYLREVLNLTKDASKTNRATF